MFAIAIVLHAYFTIGWLTTEAKRDVVLAKDFSRSAFEVTIARCQQAALEQASLAVPDPAKQLEMITMRRQRGKRGGPANLSVTYHACRLEALQ